MRHDALSFHAPRSTPFTPHSSTPTHASTVASPALAAREPKPRATSLAPAQPRRRGLSAHPPRARGVLRDTPIVRAEALEFATDLRRSPSREALEVIVHRSGCLLPEDQALMDACFSRGMRVLELARLQGVDPRVVQRRIKRLSARVISPEFSFVLNQESAWPPTRRRIARAVVLEGRTMRGASKALSISLHTVREHVKFIYALFNEHLAQRLQR
jgi:hypothetical protein